MQPRLYCNRTLNLNRIRAIGYDLDYTLVQYHVARWERRAWEHIQEALLARGWPVDGLVFEPHLVRRGLILDIDRGNAAKATRHGDIRQASHGSRMLSHDELRPLYGRTFVNLRDHRWRFLNTLFAVSEGCFFLQLVDLLDQGRLPAGLGYRGVYDAVRESLDSAHTEGQLKAEILEDPAHYSVYEPGVARALLDQKLAGKKLLLATNSNWHYARSILDAIVTPWLPEGMSWRALFDIAIVGARKPQFFESRMPVFEIVDEEHGLLKPHAGLLEAGTVYMGGDAGLVERSLGLEGEQILYVGDHLFTDVNAAKSTQRWRTALVMRDLADELQAVADFAPQQAELDRLMREKEELEARSVALRLQRARREAGQGPPEPPDLAALSRDSLTAQLDALRGQLRALDDALRPLVTAASQLGSTRWGPLMRAGNQPSHLARQVERYADVYCSSVAAFAHATPYAYLRGSRGVLAHE